MAVATLATRPTFQAWTLEASQSDDEACHHLLQFALEEILAAATEYHVTVPAAWITVGDQPGPTRNTIGEVAAWLEAYGDDADDLTEECADAWRSALDDIAGCRDYACMCGYDHVESLLECATEQLSEMEDAAGRNISWWAYAARELRGGFDMNASDLLKMCHRGDGLSWFKFDVTDDGHISAECDANGIELYPLDGNRQILADALSEYGYGDEHTAAKLFAMSDDAAMIASTLVTDMDEAGVAGNVNEMIDAAVLLTELES